jgi:small subunit ribosomal protein S17
MSEQTVSTKRGHDKLVDGVVVSTAMDKTVVVKIVRLEKHPHYEKYVRRTKRCVAHDERNECTVGDTVRIVETRPLSKTKRWRVRQILTKAV